MHIGEPDRDAAPAPSLAGRLGGVLRAGTARLRMPGGGGDWRIAAALAALIALGPVLTIGGAKLLTAQVRAQNARLSEALAPRIAASQGLDIARGALAPVLRRAGPATTLEALARVLPTDTQLVRAERPPAGTLELEIAAADPDRLRAALRRAPSLAALRNTGQREADGAIVVTFAGAAQ